MIIHLFLRLRNERTEETAPGPNHCHEAWQNRIVGLDPVDPKTLTANDRNGRIHTPEQTRALAGAIGDVIRSVTVNQRTGRIADEKRGQRTCGDSIRVVGIYVLIMSEKECTLSDAMARPKTNNSTADRIRRRVKKADPDTVFHAAQFLDLRPRTAVDKALSLYVIRGQTVNIQY